jgi:signal peptidase I
MGNKAGKKTGRALNILVIALIVMALVIVSELFFVVPIFAKGQSMSPTIKGGSVLVIDKFTRTAPGRGDIIAIKTRPEDEMEGATLIKRVIAVGGDTVECDVRGVSVNGAAIDEPYANGVTDPFPAETVPDGGVFVMGDNREDSLDSRDLGCFGEGDIYGRVLFCAVPFRKL